MSYFFSKLTSNTIDGHQKSISKVYKIEII